MEVIQSRSFCGLGVKVERAGLTPADRHLIG